MTALDIGIMIMLVLVTWAGYRQGCVRGTIRMLALLAVGMLSAVVLMQLPPGGTMRSSLVQAGLVLASIALAIFAIAWLLNHLVPRRVHDTHWNRTFGVVPALAQALVIIAIVLGLAHRLAITPDQQRYIAEGKISGPLSQPLLWLERAVVSQL
jgi:uncharacterized membrane protein required for colicin V production